MTFFYRNKGPSSMSNFAVRLTTLLAYCASSCLPRVLNWTRYSRTADPHGRVHETCHHRPTTVAYTDGLLGTRSNKLLLPVNTSTFNEPLTLAPNDFSMRWEQLQGYGQHMQQVLKPPNRIVPAMVVEGMSKSLRFGVVNGMPDESEFVRYGASSLRTGALGPNGEKVSVGCLVKIEMNVQSNQVRVTARTLHKDATAAVFESAKSLLF